MSKTRTPFAARKPPQPTREFVLARWDQFAVTLQGIQQMAEATASTAKPWKRPTLLFRGQGDWTWRVLTTLERAHGHDRKGRKAVRDVEALRKERLPFMGYYDRLFRTYREAEAFSGREFPVPDSEEVIADILLKRGVVTPELPGYEYMLYLRHHGFPSPLLDWSLSPYVAAFFAFRDPPESATHVAIDAYIHEPAKQPKLNSGQPLIIVPNIRVAAHRRHFVQRSSYTLCMIDDRNDLGFIPHEAVLNRDDTQAFTIRLPVTQRAAALRELDAMNVNAYSLMGSEDSLIATLHMREFVTQFAPARATNT